MKPKTEVKARESYSVGYIAVEYKLELRCWRCGGDIPFTEPVFHVSRFRSDSLITYDYHLRCAPKRELKRVLNKIERALGGCKGAGSLQEKTA